MEIVVVSGPIDKKALGQGKPTNVSVAANTNKD
jgi:hypothetical protein